MSEDEERDVGGRPPHVPTVESKAKALALRGLNATLETIARQMEISVSTLQRHYSEELKAGPDFANTLVAQNLHTIALGKPKNVPFSAVVRAATFWLERRAKWTKDESTKPSASLPSPGAAVVPPARRILFVFQAPPPRIEGPDPAEAL